MEHTHGAEPMNDDHFGNREEMIARYRALQAETGATIATLRADLARVTGECVALNGSCNIVKDRAERAERERDEARAKIEALTLTRATLDITRAVLQGLRATGQRVGPHTPRTEAALAELARYAKALGGV